MEIKLGNNVFNLPDVGLRLRRQNQLVLKAMSDSGERQLTSIIAANRITAPTSSTVEDLLHPSLRDMAYWQLKDIERAALRIVEAKKRGEVIALVTDFDTDGICSAVVMYQALTKYMGIPVSLVQPHINNRMVYGYGFNPDALNAVFERAGDNIPTLIITADQGSNDTATIRDYKARMHELGKDYADVIVTDHHHVKKNENCADAYAFVNPQREDDEFSDKTICGCVVALLVMSAAREYMIKDGCLPESAPRLTPLLTYASLATVADCVSLQSRFNRCIIRKGLKDMNDGVLPAWKVLRQQVKSGELITYMDLGFKVGPAINADSRTGGDGMSAFHFLLSETIDDATYWYSQLHAKNERRKEIDLVMQQQALFDASEQYYKLGRRGIAVYLPRGSHGIQGIVGSRVKEAFNCPVIIFSPHDVNEQETPEKRIVGSGRSIPGFNIIGIVQDGVEQTVKTLKSGGHSMAMGMSVYFKDFKNFQAEFDRQVKLLADPSRDDEFSPEVMIDHVFTEVDLHMLDSLEILDDINRLSPYGQRFEEPIFGLNVTLTKFVPFGMNDSHLKVFFKDSLGGQREAVVFGYERKPWTEYFAVGQKFTFAVKLAYDSYRRKVGMQLEAAVQGVNAVQSAR